MYKVHIEDKKQIIRANRDITAGETITLLIKSEYLVPKLTFIGKLIKHSTEPNCGFKHVKLNTYYLVSTSDIKDSDILTINIKDGPWYLSENRDV